MVKLPFVPARTTPGFAFSILERSLKDCLAVRQFRGKEVLEVIKFFGKDPPECAFCGSLEVARWDHLIALNKGGETVIGNMVLACARCDDSKRDLPYEEWALHVSQGSPTSRGVEDVEDRLARIKAYMQHYNYAPRFLSERLSAEELQALTTIRAKLQEVRSEIDTLIQEYRSRTGYS